MLSSYVTIENILQDNGKRHRLLLRDSLMVSSVSAKKRQLHLYGRKDMLLPNKTKQKAYVAGVVANKAYTSLYLMGIYAFPERFELSPALAKLKKGKSCFHITALEPPLVKEIEHLVERNTEEFIKEKWI